MTRKLSCGNLPKVIQERLNLFNVNIFILDEDYETLVLKAFAGGFGEDLVVGYSLRIGEGIKRLGCSKQKEPCIR